MLRPTSGVFLDCYSRDPALQLNFVEDIALLLVRAAEESAIRAANRQITIHARAFGTFKPHALMGLRREHLKTNEPRARFGKAAGHHGLTVGRDGLVAVHTRAPFVTC